MTDRKPELWLQVTALSESLEFRTIEFKPGLEPGIVQSALISEPETGLDERAKRWRAHREVERGHPIRVFTEEAL